MFSHHRFGSRKVIWLVKYMSHVSSEVSLQEWVGEENQGKTGYYPRFIRKKAIKLKVVGGGL